ncbi:MAG TPA: hypothetical protein VHY09_00195 [Candidatus Methylacidiphilales bacterium]|jgi:hypothetical protein|nr:hypothetical protein [Candidatus Methylacidiphilales bacterium]
MDEKKAPEPTPEPSATHGGHNLLSQPLSEIHPFALLEPWINFVPQQQRRLGLFICLALALHATICLFLVVDTSVSHMRHDPHLYVSLDYPRALAVSSQVPDRFWDQLTDPRVFLLPHNTTADLTAGLPSWMPSAAAGPDAMPPPAPPEIYRPAQPATSPLEQQVADAMVPPRVPFAYDETPVAMVKQTTWQWDDALAARHPAGALDLPTLTSDTNLTPTRLRVAVNPDGFVEHALLEPISDDLSTPVDAATAEQAVAAAQKIRFDPVTTPGLQWGRITIFWNYAAKPREEVVPTPPAAGQ